MSGFYDLAQVGTTRNDGIYPLTSSRWIRFEFYDVGCSLGKLKGKL